MELTRSNIEGIQYAALEVFINIVISDEEYWQLSEEINLADRLYEIINNKDTPESVLCLSIEIIAKILQLESSNMEFNDEVKIKENIKNKIY